MHHIDVHVRNVQDARRFYEAVMTAVGYTLRNADDGYVAFWREGVRPSVGIITDGGGTGSGSMRLAFAVAQRDAVDEAARIAAGCGAKQLEGPSYHPEYGDDYYAVFFEDPDGNKFEIVLDRA